MITDGPNPTGFDDRIEQLSPGKLDQLLKRLQARGGAAVEGIRPRARSAEGSPLSFSQERLWFLDELQPGSAVYNVPAAFRLRGPLDVAVLASALGAIVQRHEALRTTFAVAGGRPVQVAAPEGRLALPVIDLQSLPSAARETEAARLRADAAARPFDLARGPLLRTALVGLAAGDHVLLLTLHHIVADAWSLGVLIRELGDFYQAFFECRPPSLPALPVQYVDYVLWQRERLQGERLANRLAYWQGRLAGLPVLELPTDRPRPAVQSGRGRRRPAVFPGAPLAGLKALADSEGATLFMVLLAAFELLLRRYTGQDDLAVGASVANREPSEVEPLIGFFVNTVVMRGLVREEETGREWLRAVRSSALAAYANQELPFEKLVEELRPERSLDRNPLVQVLFSLQNAPLALELPGTGLFLTLLDTDNGTSKLDLNLALWETPAGLAGEVEYSTDLFETATVARLERHFETLLAGLAAAPDRPLAELSLLCPEERQQLLAEWNDTRTPMLLTAEPEPCLHRLFERQAERSPDAVAVACEGRELTYRGLHERADRLARRLRALGVGPEVPVAVAAERSLEAVVGLLAVLKAGGAYLPLDPSYPRERLALMLRDSRAALLLAQPHLAAGLPADGVRTVLLDGGQEDAEAALPEPEPDSLAYVIYTSGSTGTPKGAMNTHRAVVNRILWSQRLYRLEPADRVLQKTPFSFDISVWELFWPLLTGARLVLARPGGHKDSSYLAGVIAEQGITTMHFVPSMLQVFLEEAALPSPGPLRRVIASGEALTPAHRDRFLARFDVPLYNLYGPTEAAIEVTAWPCAGEGLRGTVPIGRPIDNVTIHLLDEALRPVPAGVPGQLHIGGMAPARGYLHRPDLTAERFVPDPFAASPGGRLYATGDLARYLPDGTVESRGRIDHQHKLRGFRIELGEVEAVLRGQPGVAEAVAMVREDRAGDPRLVAYAVAAGGECSADGLRQALADRLPAPMVPAAIVLMDALPLTPNGKVDRKALPAPDSSREEAAGAAPGTPVQEMLAALWRELLGIEDIRLGDNFFEAGGHSLRATQLRSRVQSVFGLALPLQSFFTAQTLALQAELVEAGLRQGAAVAPPIAPVPRDGDLPLSFAQQRLWFLDQLEPGTALYNVPLVGDLRGVVDVAALARSFAEIVRRHESLRTTFPETAAGAVQKVAPPEEVHVPLPVIDASGLPPAARARELERLTLAEARRSFDLARGPLLRTFLLRDAEREHVLLISMHHIITDGWSTGVIVRELSAFYHGFATGRFPS
ncbi:MAG TPA: amino acid adenylation domain-containing protein, partial [Thermoanaerobaculia bacterium]|nr:amino acid adenylation domain-containing protein [Thermoanaerobaculia bacterium]